MKILSKLNQYNPWALQARIRELEAELAAAQAAQKTDNFYAVATTLDVGRFEVKMYENIADRFQGILEEHVIEMIRELPRRRDNPNKVMTAKIAMSDAGYDVARVQVNVPALSAGFNMWLREEM